MLKTLPRSKTRTGTAFVDLGKGDETTILIHGVGMRIEAWTPQLEQLSKAHRVVAVDLPGHGESALLDDAARLPDFVAWFDHFLGELDIGTANVVGHSMGALIASGIVATAPEKVRRVALLNGVYRRTDAAREAVKTRAKQIGSGRFDPFAPLARWFDAADTHSATYELVRDLLASVNPAGYATAYHAFAEGDAVYSDCWPAVRCPALFLTGSDDHNSTAAMADAMAAATPKGQAVVIQGHRHMVNLTAPEQVDHALQNWLSAS